MHPFLLIVYVLGRDNNDSHPATLNRMKLSIDVVENRKKKKIMRAVRRLIARRGERLYASFGVLLRKRVNILVNIDSKGPV